MKILTIGASPYLLVRNGKMHAAILKYCFDNNLDVHSAVWHHDESYFVPEENTEHEYVLDNKVKCKLFAFTPRANEASPVIYELLKQVQPNIIITIGDYKDTNFVAAIKLMYPNLFKWVAIYTTDVRGILPNNKDAFEMADYVITTTKQGIDEIKSFANIIGSFEPYGCDHTEFYNENLADRHGVLFSARNSQASNIAAFIMSTSSLSCPKHLHTNLYDPGDYSIDYLRERYKNADLTYTTEYCSIKEGISNDRMRKMYNKYAFYVDCSIKSATALSMLEAMSCGCVPIGPDYGRVGEIIAEMPKEFQLYLPYNIFVSANQEEFAIIDSERLPYLINSFPKDCLELASKCAIQIANKYTVDIFVQQVFSHLRSILINKVVIPLETI